MKQQRDPVHKCLDNCPKEYPGSLTEASMVWDCCDKLPTKYLNLDRDIAHGEICVKMNAIREAE